MLKSASLKIIQKQSYDPAIINKLILDFHRISYKKITIVQQDLASCFDRTIQNITNICNQKYHIPIEVCRLNTKIKQEIKFHITLSQGTSKKYYTNSKEIPVHGLLQG